jgi:adenine-specific DNA-methyltransferase
MDFYEGELDFEPGIEKKVKPFSWRNAFPKVFKEGGFDCVIGNPPYVRIQSLNETSEDSVNYFKRKYQTSKTGNYDLYVLFVEKGFSILNGNGILGFILPNKFFNTDYGKGLRKFISENGSLNEIIDFEQYQVFENATTYCCLLFLENKKNKSFLYSKSLSNSNALENLLKEEINTESIDSEVWNFYSSKDEKVLSKLFNKSSSLIELPSDISRGSSTGNDKIFVFEVDHKGVLKNESNESIELEEGILKIPIYATDFGRYSFKPKKNYRILFPYKIIESRATLIDEEVLKKEYPKAYKYLLSKRKEL